MLTPTNTAAIVRLDSHEFSPLATGNIHLYVTTVLIYRWYLDHSPLNFSRLNNDKFHGCIRSHMFDGFTTLSVTAKHPGAASS